MTDKKIDSLFKKQDIKLSQDFNDSIFAQLKDCDSKIDEMFSEQKIKLDSEFNDSILDEARIDAFFAKSPVQLKDSFTEALFAKIESEKTYAPKFNIWAMLTKVSTVAALFVAGVFITNSYFLKDDLIPEDSKIYSIAKENIHNEIDYFLLADEMNELSQEIDKLEASILELESYANI